MHKQLPGGVVSRDAASHAYVFYRSLPLGADDAYTGKSAHTFSDVLMLQHKLKLIDFSSLQKFEVRSTFGEEIQVFP